MEDLDLPTQRIPLQLFDRFCARAHGQIGEQLPTDSLPAFGRAALLRVNHRQFQRPVVLLLRDGCQHEHPTVSQFEHGLGSLAVLIAHGDTMEAFDPNLLHSGIGFRGPILDEAGIGAADHEVRPDVMRRAEQFVNVGLAVADMHAPLRCAEQRRRRHEILDPTHTLFLPNRDSGRVHPALQFVGPFERFSRPELHRG
ncbi:MAG TPA: hypothetical protein VHO24_00525 [Opitutaceae bacterium]|nr:hypothetical protein [Opitutaceae bacterium]